MVELAVAEAILFPLVHPIKQEDAGSHVQGSQSQTEGHLEEGELRASKEEAKDQS